LDEKYASSNLKIQILLVPFDQYNQFKEKKQQQNWMKYKITLYIVFLPNIRNFRMLVPFKPLFEIANRTRERKSADKLFGIWDLFRSLLEIKYQILLKAIKMIILQKKYNRSSSEAVSLNLVTQ
jgi:hypothetical protein